MRIWSLHPSYLDSRALVAVWRETLLARKVLLGKTRGYKNHPQLLRFKALSSPAGAVSVYLKGIFDEAVRRGYSFNLQLAGKGRVTGKIPVTRGQVDYERKWLLTKLKRRDPARYKFFLKETRPKLHPIFTIRAGPVESWEKPVEGV